MLITPACYTSKQMFQANVQTKEIIVNGKRLIPAVEYKGPVLKLTKADCKNIDELQKKIENFEFEHMKISSLLMNKNLSNNSRDYYSEVCLCIEYQINALRDEIKNIKLQRHQKQLAKMN